MVARETLVLFVVWKTINKYVDSIVYSQVEEESDYETSMFGILYVLAGGESVLLTDQ